MTANGGDYLLVVQAPAHSLPGGRFATESAFAQHLRAIRRELGPRFKRLVLLAPGMARSEFERGQSSLAVIDEEADGIFFHEAFPSGVSRISFWSHYAQPLRRRIRELVSKAAVVHSGLSDDLWRPLMALVNWVAWRAGRPLVFVVDIDFRRDSDRYRAMGVWGLRAYLINRWVYDPLKWLQVWHAVRAFDLVLLKSRSMVGDFGRGRGNVRNFYDTVHQPGDLISPHENQLRQAMVKRPDTPLRLVYFGRLVPYKGVAHSIESVVRARTLGANVQFTIIGSGECEHDLRCLVGSLKAESFIEFVPPVPYGEPLFSLLADQTMMLASPIAEDTPRAAFDALARGIPIVAFDTDYYRDLAESSGAVFLSPWPDQEKMGDLLLRLSDDRGSVADAMAAAVNFATANTQPRWIRRRMDWVEEICDSRKP